ncbi:MAG: hypothetical protein BRD30_13575 [Bacteroidetes bacterium QH_2_63_10]|nr:MAG: hypothetical protein BRD30_13575 [Bacteroidetes bacterium QH_2_63_10]
MSSGGAVEPSTARTTGQTQPLRCDAACRVVQKPLERTPLRIGVDAYASFWKRLHADQSSVPDRPEVDFEDTVVVAIVLGQRPTGGHSVEIDEVRATDDGGEMRVTFTETVPGDGCLVTQALTSPYVLATVEAQDEEFTFESSTKTRSC